MKTKQTKKQNRQQYILKYNFNYKKFDYDLTTLKDFNKLSGKYKGIAIAIMKKKYDYFLTTLQAHLEFTKILNMGRTQNSKSYEAYIKGIANQRYLVSKYLKDNFKDIEYISQRKLINFDILNKNVEY
ncbi:MAG: hypothetical protein ACRCXT_11610 [Paraclostridium sp.]